MNRRVTRNANLKTCRCNLDEFEALISELSAFFPSGATRVRIEVHLSGEELEFTNVGQLRDYSPLPSKLTQVELHVDGELKHIVLSSKRVTTSSGTHVVFTGESTGDNPAWCVGANEILREFSKRHHRWYYGAIVPLFVAMVLGVFLAHLLGRMHVIPAVVYTGWSADALFGMLIGLLILLLAAFGPISTLLEPFVLQIREEQGFVKRNFDKITLVLIGIPALDVAYHFVMWLYDKWAPQS